MKKKAIYAILLITIIVGCLVGLVFAENNDIREFEKEEEWQDPDMLIISLIGKEEIVIVLGEEFIDEGAIIFVEGLETDFEYEVFGEVDNAVPGEYIITYRYNHYEAKRTVIVKDNIPPMLTLIGSKEIIIAEGNKYEELGYKADDNIDGDITSRVIIEGAVGSKIGTYKLTYSVSDDAGNKATAIRTVKVIKRLTIQHPNPDNGNNIERPANFNNEITNMEYINNGIRVTGTNDRQINSISLVEASSIRKYDYAAINAEKNYTANIDLARVANGNYNVFLNGEEFSEHAVNKLPNIYRIKRTKIGDKLITFEYINNNIQIKVQNFAYEYDVLIDVGHGGADPGAVNSTHYEKNINLTVSLYEAKRFREHGLRVLLTRSGDSLELLLGDSDWRELSRRVYAMGYYGVVSKIVYSNHHNSFGTSSRMGPEIIVPATLTKSELAPELLIMSLWTTFTPLTENHVRFYTRDYNRETIHNKVNGEVYTFTNYYAVNRVPFELFNVKAIIFEPAYMSNASNFRWYWLEENWIQMSEMKIKTYVEHLGIKYIEPK